MKNKIEDLRNHLFETIEGLLDRDRPLDVERAKAIAAVGTVIVNSAKVEVDAMKQLGLTEGSGFLPDESQERKGPRALAAGERRR